MGRVVTAYCSPRARPDDISSVTVEGIPASYGALATAEIYDQPSFFLLPGVLQDFDLTDVFAVSRRDRYWC